MADISLSETALRFRGNDLDPDEISATLGVKPTRSYRQGALFPMVRRQEIAARTGLWSLQAPSSSPGDVDGQVMSLLALATEDLDAWCGLSKRYTGAFFVGLFLEQGNEGFSIRPNTLAAVASRGLGLELDIYKLREDDERDAS